MDSMDFVDISDEKVDTKRKKDKFMTGIYISLIVLVVLAFLVYFFGYDILKPLIRV